MSVQNKTDRVWLITGCSTGIGREIANIVLASGQRAAVTARNPDSVADLVAAYPDQALALALDVTENMAVTAAVNKTQQHFGTIDVLVNNAGYGYMSALEEGEDAEVRKLFDTNFFGVVDLIKAVLPIMREQRSGYIINMSSMTGLVTNPPNIYYSCTKYAMEALTEGLADSYTHMTLPTSDLV